MATKKAKVQPNLERARDLCAYINRGVTPYHAVAETVRRLEAAGYRALPEGEAWSLAAGDKRYVVRSGSTVIAFQVGSEPPARAGFRMVGAHTDSPNLRLKPRAAYAKHGFHQLGVEVYGGALLSTWLDRDLGVAGRVAIAAKRGVRLEQVDLARPVARVPNLAIHLNRDVNRDGLKLNPQRELPPLLGLVGAGKAAEDKDVLLELLARELGVGREAILDHDLMLYDLTPATLGGLSDELIFAARLDNLGSSYAATAALVEAAPTRAKETRLIALYDHEEVGSRSVQGAAGPFLEEVLGRIVDCTSGQERQGWARAMAASFQLSADMAHGVHPNYADKHEPQHMPMVGQGPVVKTNTGQSYATDGESAARFIRLAQDVGVKPQSFVVRTDLPCGSTIGPISATRLGVKTVDIGNPMLSMHSAREMAGSADVELMHRVMVRFFEA